MVEHPGTNPETVGFRLFVAFMCGLSARAVFSAFHLLASAKPDASMPPDPAAMETLRESLAPFRVAFTSALAPGSRRALLILDPFGTDTGAKSSAIKCEFHDWESAL